MRPSIFIATIVAIATIPLIRLSKEDLGAAALGQVRVEDEPCLKARKKVLQRAQEWMDDNVPYDFHLYHKGYRAQCSGFLSFAWNISNPYTHNATLRCYELEDTGTAVVIPKEDLQLGDSMVCNMKKFWPSLKPKDKPKKRLGQQGGGHCLVFEQWANENKTSYIGWEQCQDAHCKDTVRREIPYPYFYKKGCWEPMRFTGLPEEC